MLFNVYFLYYFAGYLYLVYDFHNKYKYTELRPVRKFMTLPRVQRWEHVPSLTFPFQRLRTEQNGLVDQDHLGLYNQKLPKRRNMSFNTPDQVYTSVAYGMCHGYVPN